MGFAFYAVNPYFILSYSRVLPLIVKLKVPLQVPLKVKVKVKVKVRTWSGHGQVRSGQVRL